MNREENWRKHCGKREETKGNWVHVHWSQGCSNVNSCDTARVRRRPADLGLSKIRHPTVKEQFGGCSGRKLDQSAWVRPIVLWRRAIIGHLESVGQRTNLGLAFPPTITVVPHFLRVASSKGKIATPAWLILLLTGFPSSRSVSSCHTTTTSVSLCSTSLLLRRRRWTRASALTTTNIQRTPSGAGGAVLPSAGANRRKTPPPRRSSSIARASTVPLKPSRGGGVAATHRQIDCKYPIGNRTPCENTLTVPRAKPLLG